MRWRHFIFVPVGIFLNLWLRKKAPRKWSIYQTKFPPSSRTSLVRCFGDFEILMDGEPVPFLRAKSEELLACVIVAL